jgi:Domain of unknown function (DUF4129)
VTARQQIARLLPLVLLVVLVVVGLRGIVTAPRWDGPLRSQGAAIGIAVEVVFGALLLALRSRAAAARREREARPYDPSAADQDIEPAQALRAVLRFLLPACMIAVAVVVLVNLHLHFFSGKAAKPVAPPTALPKLPTGTPKPLTGSGLHIPVGPILYGLLIALIVVAVVVSVWWSTRLRRPAAAPVITDVTTEDLRQAVDEGRAALAAIDDARAAIIACYLAMEARLADRGTARAAADTPDELLARAVAAGTVRGRAAGRLTALFYEARFSTHPLAAGQRDAASAALDELAAELAPAETDAAKTDTAETDAAETDAETDKAQA